MQGCFLCFARIKSIALRILTKTKVKLPRSSSRLPRRPATENAWQGVPPTNTSGASISPTRILAVSLVISPWFDTFGQRWASTALGKGSISANHAGCQPKGSHANDAASTPLQTLAYLMIYPSHSAATVWHRGRVFPAYPARWRLSGRCACLESRARCLHGRPSPRRWPSIAV